MRHLDIYLVRKLADAVLLVCRAFVTKYFWRAQARQLDLRAQSVEDLQQREHALRSELAQLRAAAAQPTQRAGNRGDE